MICFFFIFYVICDLIRSMVRPGMYALWFYKSMIYIFFTDADRVIEWPIMIWYDMIWYDMIWLDGLL